MISGSNDASLDDLSPDAAEAVEEMTAQLAKGERIDLDAICQRHPAAATQLRRLFPTVAAMASLGDSVHGEGVLPSAIDHEPLSGTLGDFRLIGELGRGGMGIVYEAEQLSLGRRVALKVLPLAALLDPRQLQRFKNESQAAAMLKHPNIVSVHAVGADRGMHFYAMELIQGQSLAEVIAQLRDRHVTRNASTEAPTDRPKRLNQHSGSTATDTTGGDTTDGDTTGGDAPAHDSSDTSPVAAISTERGFGSTGYYHNVARLGIELADALQYAHTEGVIHRDIKPSNLLLNERGEINIADFGLARFQTDQDLTVTGELLGTLRYMSPEQAEGRRLLDHRTDIYSLGLVLYELLTLKAAFSEQDRTRLLRQILEADPPPPRHLVSSVPRDLETVILKAIAKQPEVRYTSARELAMDLQRFREHQPIHARRVSRAERCRWWIRRNPVLSGMAFLVLALLTFLAVSGPVVAMRQRSLAKRLTNKNYALTSAAAIHAWNEGDIQRTEHLLAPLFSDRSPKARRGFETRYLWNRCRRIDERPTLKHPGPVGPVAYSQNGKRLTTAGWDGVVRIWDLSTRQVLGELRPETSQGVAALDYSPDESMLATGSDSGIIQIWNVEDLRQIHVLRHHATHIRTVCYSPDGCYLASTAMDGLVLLWDLKTATNESEVPCVELGRFSNKSARVVFSPDGAYVAASGDEPAEVRIWALADNRLIETLPGSRKGTYKLPLSFSPDGKRLACGHHGEVVLWSTETWKPLSRIGINGNQVESVAFSPNGHALAVAEYNRARLYDVHRGDLIKTLLTQKSKLYAIDWSPDGKQIAMSARDGSVVTCDVANRIGLPSSERRNLYTDIEFIGTRRDRRLLVIHSDFQKNFGSVSVLDLATGVWDTKTTTRFSYMGLARNPANPGIAALGIAEDGKNVIRVWDVNADRTLATLPGDSHPVFGMAFSPDGQRLATASLDFNEKDDSTISLWDLNRGTRRKLDQASFACGLVFFPDGRRLAVSGGMYNRGYVRIYDVETGEILHEFTSRDQMICVAISPTAETIFAGGIGNFSAMWELETYEARFSIESDDGGAFCATYSSDGRTVAASHGGGRIRLWDGQTGDRLGDLETGHRIISLAFSDDDALLAAGCSDGSVAVWGRDGSTNVWHPAFLNLND